MKPNRLSYGRVLTVVFCSLLVLFSSRTPLFAWGQKGHFWATEKAVDSLQGPLAAFLSRERQQLVRRSIDADLRKKDVPEESQKHFVDLESYGPFPFHGFSTDRRALEKVWGVERVTRSGTVVWTIEETFENLVDAFRNRDRKKILIFAADLSHYLADIHQPFHASANFNGQLTGQTGIHFRFEKDLLDLFLDRVPFQHAQPIPVGDVKEQTFQILLDSWQWVDNILASDWQIVEEQKIDRSQFASSKDQVKLYPMPYFEALFEKQAQLLQRQLNGAARQLASFWTAAWERAGAPEF